MEAFLKGGLKPKTVKSKDVTQGKGEIPWVEK